MSIISTKKLEMVSVASKRAIGSAASQRGLFRKYADLAIPLYLYSQKHLYKNIYMKYFSKYDYHKKIRMIVYKTKPTSKLRYSFFTDNVEAKQYYKILLKRGMNTLLFFQVPKRVIVLATTDIYLPDTLQKDLKKNYEMIPVFINIFNPQNLGSHANMVFFYPKTKTAELFEPHGHGSTTSQKHRDLLKKTLKSKYGYKLKPLITSCPYFGPQQRANAFKGMCTTWSVMITQLYFMNHKTMSLLEVQKQLLESFTRGELVDMILKYNKKLEMYLKRQPYRLLYTNVV